MKKFPLFSLFCLCLFATPAYAQPVQVTVHPQGARVTEETIIQADTSPTLVRIPLPAGIDRQSLHVRPKDDTAAAIVAIRLQDTVAPLPQALEGLYKELEEEKSKLFIITARVQARDAQIRFWMALSPEYAEGKLDTSAATLRSQIEQLNLEQFTDTETRDKQQKHVTALEQQINAAGGVPAIAPELVLEVVAKNAGNTALLYTYTVPNAGWSPFFSLSAWPEENIVRMRVDAMLYQQSGQSWLGIPVTLSTANLYAAAAPRPLVPWELMPVPEAMPVAAPSARNFAAKSMDVMDSEMAVGAFASTAVSAPVYDEGKGVSTWKLPNASIPSGPESRVFLAEEKLDARFMYIARPIFTPSVYLSATLEKAPAAYPAGDAEFFLENEPMGKGYMDTAGITHAPLFFGRDPAITTRYTMPVFQTGQTGIFDKAQTHTWEYIITVDNTHTFPVSVRVEDSLPEIRDERIKVSYKSEPAFSTEEKTLFWLLDIAGGESAQIRHHVSANAPADMPIFSRR